MSSFQFQLCGASVTLGRKLQVCRGAWVSSRTNAWTSLHVGFILLSEKEWFNSPLQHGSMSRVLCSLFPVSICVWGRRSLFRVCSGCRLFRVRICAPCAASSTGRVGFTWKPRVSLLDKLLVEIKASLFFGLFCLAAFGWWYSDTRRKKPLSTVSWICLCRRMWHCVYPVSVLCGHYTGRHLFSLSCPTYCWNSVMLIHQRHFSDPLNCTGLLWSKRD